MVSYDIISGHRRRQLPNAASECNGGSCNHTIDSFASINRSSSFPSHSTHRMTFGDEHRELTNRTLRSFDDASFAFGDSTVSSYFDETLNHSLSVCLTCLSVSLCRYINVSWNINIFLYSLKFIVFFNLFLYLMQ